MVENERRIGLIEDDEAVNEVVSSWAEVLGYKLVISITEADTEVDFTQLEPGDILFVDGNLSGLTTGGTEGAAYVQQIKAAQPKACVVWTSSDPFPGDSGPYRPDLIIAKPELGQLGKLIDRIVRERPYLLLSQLD